MRTKVSSKGQVVLPAELRAQDGIQAGQEFEIRRVRSGEYLLKRAKPAHGALLKWLTSCPEKGWFQRIPSESTDSL